MSAPEPSPRVFSDTQRRLISFAAAVLALLAGCTTPDETTSTPESTAQTETKFSIATAATNQLGLELFRQIASTKPGENLLLSPYSIQSALAMTYAGADGNTRAEMARVLHFPVDDAPLATSFGALRGALAEAVKKAKAASDDGATYYKQQAASMQNDIQKLRATGKEIPPNLELGLGDYEARAKDFNSQLTELHIANGLFGQTGYEYHQVFLDFVHDRYGASLQQLNFQADANLARSSINAWIAGQTENKIRDIIPADSVDATTRLVLVNTLYFKSYWQSQFQKVETYDLPFKVRGTQSADVPTMHQTATFGYAQRDGYTAVAMPYQGGDLQFLILLPNNPDGVDVLAAQVTPELLRDCAKLELRKVDLWLPKFGMEAPAIPLGKMLKALGLKQAFDDPPGSANFQRMAARQTDRPIALTDIIHKVSLSLDEHGTVAVAMTAPEYVAHSIEEFQAYVNVDHPFLFAIQHRESGVCLFLGRVTDPR